MNKTFTYVSAFAGIGGMTLGLKDLGGKGLMAWEYDPTEKRTQYAQEAHKLLHPDIPVHGDICEVDTNELPNFDLLCFTPPCQAFSVAGKRGGFDDTRGTLTFEALRIAKAKRPKILFMENVKGLVNHDKGNTMGTIIHAINEIGYTVDFTVLNSKYFDVAQNRERVYLVAIRNDLITPEPWNDTKGNTMLPKAKKRYQEEGAITFNFDWPKQTEVRTRLRDFLEDNVDERYYLAEDKTQNLVKQFEEGLAIKEATKQGYSVAAEGAAVNIAFLNSTPHRGRVGRQMANTIEASGVNQGVVEVIPVLTPFREEKRQNGPRFKEDGAEAHTITTVDRHGVLLAYTEALDFAKLCMGGDADISVKIKENGDLRPHRNDPRKSGVRSITAVNYEGNIANTCIAAHTPKFYGESTCYRIRKLTPKECLRLQSLPDWAIDILLENFSDSRVYKFAGNGLTTNVIKAIGEKLLKYL